MPGKKSTTPKSSPKTAKDLRERLQSRQPAARGADAAKKIQPALDAAERRHSIQREAKVRLAAQHNAKAKAVPVQTREAQGKARDALKATAEESMNAHAERHQEAVRKVAAKGASEADKVDKVVAALQEATVEQARQQDEHMQAAAERRARQLQAVAEKGHAEAEKVEEAALKLRAEAQEKAAAIEAANVAAAERRAAQLGAIAAKGHAESEKIDTAANKLRLQTEAKAAILDAASASAAERRQAKLGAIAAKGHAEVVKVDKVVGGKIGRSPPALTRQDGTSPMRPSPPSPDSVLWGNLQANQPQRVRSPPAKTLPSTAALSREAGLLLVLMRGGAPNHEVLLAQTTDELAAIAAKYEIALPDSVGDGIASLGGQAVAT